MPRLVRPSTAVTSEPERAEALRPETLDTSLTTIITRVTRTRVHAGVLVAEGGQPYLDLEMDSPYE